MSKEEENKEETPEPKKDNKFVRFVKRHKTGIIVGTALAVTGTALTVMTRNGKLARQMASFIAEQGLESEFLGLDEGHPELGE